MSRRRALIVGAGIAGLVAGHSLRRAGFDVSVYERRPDVEGTAASLGIWPPHMAILDGYGFGDEIVAVAVPEASMAVWDPAGNVLPAPPFAEVCAEYEHPYCTVFRPELNRVMATQLGDVVQTGKRLTEYRETADGVEARFDDRSVETGDLLVGADGVGSVVRRQMHPTVELMDGAQVAWRAVTDPEGLTLPEQQGAVIGREATRAGWLRVGGGKVFWVVARFGVTSASPASVRKEALAQVRHVYDGGWDYPLKRLIEATPEEAIHRDAIAIVPPLPTWIGSRAALVGDAAHAMSPHVTSGAAYAIEDAHELGRLLSGGRPLAEGLREYDDRRRERMRWVAQAADEVSSLAHTDKAGYAKAWVEFVSRSLATAPAADGVSARGSLDHA